MTCGSRSLTSNVQRQRESQVKCPSRCFRHYAKTLKTLNPESHAKMSGDIHTDAPMTFWQRVGRIAKEIGFPERPRTADDEEPPPAPSIVMLYRLRDGELPLGQLSSSEERWLRKAFTFLKRIDYWRRKQGSNAHCIFEFGRIYFQCLAPPHGRYLRCEAVSEEYVPEVNPTSSH
jgi:hypothetical protein